MDEKDSLFSIHINMEKEEKNEVKDKKEIEDKIKELVEDKIR